MKIHGLDSGVALYTSSQVRDIEQSYAKRFQSGTYPLMESAGKAAYKQLKAFWPEARKILVLTGKGNNGGDGYVLARLATEERKKVTLCHFSSANNLRGDALQAFKKLPHSGIRIKDWAELQLQEFDVIVDALLGTGIQGPVRAPFIDVIGEINRSGCPIMAIDVPSGLDADTGNLFNVAVKADVTVTFIGHKRGLYTGESANYRGRVRLLPLSIPQECFQKHEFNVVSENWSSLKYKLKPRLPASHKGCFGHCCVIGGATGMTGAAILAASAAARCGSGLTSARLQNGAESLVASRPEIMARNVPLDLINEQQELFPDADCLIVGPGLGRSEWAQKWMKILCNNRQLKDRTKLWDADALNWLAENPDYDDLRVLTPHPGEAGRLLGTSAQKVNQNRFAASQEIAQKYGGVCVLKGAGTIISNSRGMQIVCAVGNPGMASGGMGDVLSGIIGSLLAQGFSLLDSASLGVCIHGEAADRAAGKRNQYRGMLASDLFEFFPVLLNP